MNRAYLVTRTRTNDIVHTGTSYDVRDGVLSIWGIIEDGFNTVGVFRKRQVPRNLHTKIVSYAPGTWDRIEAK